LTDSQESNNGESGREQINWACLSSVSETWRNYHEAINLQTNSAVVVCKKCSQEYPHPRTKSDSSTSTLVKHLKMHTEQKSKISSAGSMERYVATWSGNASVMTKEEINDLLLQTMVACNWSFNQFDNPQFQFFITRLVPNHRCPSRRQMRNLLKKGADTARAEIKEKLEKSTARVSLALDCWSSSNSYNFMGITAPFSRFDFSNYLSLCGQSICITRGLT
jgi:hypothetical protein